MRFLLLESELAEVTAREMGVAGTAKLLRFIELTHATRRAIHFVSPAFRFRTIPAAADDDKFADYAITTHADAAITSDRHFRTLAGAGYKPQPITPEDFISRHLPAQPAA